MNKQPKPERLKKGLRTLVGGVVLLVGIIAIPYPGPGWLIVFGGLAILARDYPAAQKVLDYARSKYDAWNAWIKKQHWVIKSITFILTCLVVVMTLWLLNGYGIMNDILRLNQDWLQSPFVK